MTEEEKERLESAESVLRDYQHAHPDSEKIKAHFETYDPKPVDKVREAFYEVYESICHRPFLSREDAYHRFDKIIRPLIQVGGASEKECIHLGYIRGLDACIYGLNTFLYERFGESKAPSVTRDMMEEIKTLYKSIKSEGASEIEQAKKEGALGLFRLCRKEAENISRDYITISHMKSLIELRNEIKGE